MAEESRHFMNPAHGRHLMGDDGHHEAKEEHGAGKPEHHGEVSHLPSIHIHSHAKGHTVHILHKDGGHEAHEHAHGDAEGIAQHIHDHLGGGEAPEHEMEDLGGYGHGI